MIYGGSKALDAEIRINFLEGTVLMDYSTVKGDALYDSNYEVYKRDDFENQPKLTKTYYYARDFFLRSIMVWLGLYGFYFTWLCAHGFISKNGQYEHQQFLNYIFTRTDGIITKTCSGEQPDKTIRFILPSNLFVKYMLTGDYQKKIIGISLERRYVNFKIYGVFEQVRQSGWYMVFEFSEPPKEGSCTLEFPAVNNGDITL